MPEFVLLLEGPCCAIPILCLPANGLAPLGMSTCHLVELSLSEPQYLPCQGRQLGWVLKCWHLQCWILTGFPSGVLGPCSHMPTCLICRVKGFCSFKWPHLQAQCSRDNVGGWALTGISLLSVGGNKTGEASA